MTENTGDIQTDGTGAIKRRKLSAAAGGGETEQSRLLLRAVRRSLARAAADLCELPLAVMGATQKKCPSDEIEQHLPGGHLLIVLDGPGGQPGALTLDAAAVTAAIQQQTMGQVFGPAPAERQYTGTDAAMIAPLLDSMLGRAETVLEGTPDQNLIKGFRFGARAEDARSLALLLEAETYQVLTFSLDLAVGRMQGSMTLVLPQELTGEGEGDCADMSAAGPNLGSGAGVVRAELTAVLTQVRMSLDELMGLQPGDTIRIAAAALNTTELLTIEGKTVARGRLGQAAGARAIRLHNTSETAVQGRQTRQPEEFAANIGPVDVPVPADGPGPNAPEIQKLVTAGTPVDAGADAAEDLMALTPAQVMAEISELAGLDDSYPDLAKADG
jgi:flagellar motor switch/type III secretory pathway protein FliN